MVTIQRSVTNLLFSKPLKHISNTLQNLMFAELNIDEIVGVQIPSPLGIKCGSEIHWYKKVDNLLKLLDNFKEIKTQYTLGK